MNELSLNNLYVSSVVAFPKTLKRQHSTDLVVITELRWTPFLGMHTLFTKGLAQSGETGKEYSPLILFKKVIYNPEQTENLVKITASDDKEYSFSQLSLESTDVLLRCDCQDFRWRFSYYDAERKTLHGKKWPKYEAKGVRPPANPTHSVGMCKHLMKLAKVLKESGVVK